MQQRAPRAVAIACLAALFAYLLIYHLHHEKKDNGHLGDFPTFYQAAQFARQHRDIYQAGQHGQQMYVYPPLIAFLYAPLTQLSLLHAAQVMLLLTAGILLLSLLLAARCSLQRLAISQPGVTIVVAALVALLTEEQLRAQLTMLETDALVLLSFVLGLFWLDRRPLLCGLVLAFSFNIKYLSIIALPWLLLRRRWQAAGAMVLGSVLFALLPALLLGWDENLRCLRVAFGGLLRWVGISTPTSQRIVVHDLADGLSVSITSGLARLLRPHGFSNPQVLLVAALVGAAALAILLALYRRNRQSFWLWPAAAAQAAAPYRALICLEWAGLVTTALAFSPDTNARHLLLAIVVYALGVSMAISPERGPRRAMVIVALAILFFCLTMPIRALASRMFMYSAPGWGLLLAYLLIATAVPYSARARSLAAARER